VIGGVELIAFLATAVLLFTVVKPHYDA
jgi:hypothetical protein